MARHPERRDQGEPKPPTALLSPRWQEVTRFASAKLREINTAGLAFADAHPGYSREDLVANVSTSMKEKPPRVDMALDVINQLGSLSQPPDTKEPPGYVVGPDDTWGEIIVRRDLNRTDGKLIYEFGWTKEPEALTKPKAPVAQPTQPQSSKTSTYEFKTQADRDAERQARAVVTPPQPRWRQERAERRARREWRENWEKISAEREAIDAVVIDTGRERGEKALENSKETRIELGEDGVAQIVYHIGWRTNPDGSPKMGQIDRKTRRFDPEDEMQIGYAVRSDLFEYLERKAQELEGKDVEPWAPRPVTPEKLREIYDRAIVAEVIVVGSNGELSYMAHRDSLTTEYGRMDLERDVVEATKYSKTEKPLNPQFADFLRQKKSRA